MFKNIPNEVSDIISKIEESGFEAYMVGGCVRDCVMGIEPHDYDICTSTELWVLSEVKMCMR